MSFSCYKLADTSHAERKFGEKVINAIEASLTGGDIYVALSIVQLAEFYGVSSPFCG
jgi:hypothetical protein